MITFPAEEWTWSKEDFVGNLGSPFLLLQRIREEEVLKPEVSTQARQQKARKMMTKRDYRKKYMAGVNPESDTESSSNEEEITWRNIQVKEVPLRGVDEDVIEAVEDELKKLARGLKENLERNQTETLTLG